jgi:membrane protein DedA with SNARE-associated domain
MPSGRGLTILRVGALALVLAISVAIITIPVEDLERLEAFGYPGLFVLSVISNATLFLPAPGWLIVISMGARFSVPVVTLVAGSGAAIGELSGYLAGFSGQAVVEDRPMYKRMVGWMERNGGLTVFVLAALPNPFFDLAGIAAGTLRMPVWHFLLYCWLGKLIKMGAFALTGARLLELVIPGLTWP